MPTKCGQTSEPPRLALRKRRGWRLAGVALSVLALGSGAPAAGVQAQPATQPSVSRADADEREPPRSAAEWYAAGVRALERGAAEEAVRALSRAVARRPGERDYALALARAYDANDERRQADGVWRNLIRAHPEDAALLLDFAERLARRGEWAQVGALLSGRGEALSAPGVALYARAVAKLHGAGRGVGLLEERLGGSPSEAVLWAALAEILIADGRPALALERLRAAPRAVRDEPRVLMQRAAARLALGEALGAAVERRVRAGAVGRFDGEWLLVRSSETPGVFLAAPPEAGLTLIRRAIDAGLDDLAGHALHARLWVAAGQPDVGLAVLQNHEAALRADAVADVYRMFAEVAFAADALDAYLRYARQHSAAAPAAQRDGIMFAALARAAERYNERGDERMQRALLERAVALDASDAATRLKLADALRNLEEWEDARGHYQRVLELEPAHPRRGELLEYLREQR